MNPKKVEHHARSIKRSTGMASVRTARINDAREIGEVETRAWRATYAGLLPDSYLSRLEPRYQARAWTRILSHDRSSTLVAERDGKIVGFARYVPSTDRNLQGINASELRELYVDPGSQGMGVGTQLVSQVWQKQKLGGAELSIVWVLETNTKARRFYEKLGYTLDGAEKQDEFDEEEVTVVRYRRACEKRAP